MEEITFRAMGSEIYCAVDAAGLRVRQRLERLPAMFEAWERILSRFRRDSELSLLNACPGQAVHVSEILWRVLKLARRAERWSEGLVTPTVLNALEAAGYVQSFELMQLAAEQGHPPTAPDVGPGAAAWQVDDTRQNVTLPPGVRLDLGGVGKGWAAEQTAMLLGELGPSMVDAGGDMVVSAPCNAGAWQVGIENPFDLDDDETLPMLRIARGAVATSGKDFRKWIRAGHTAHHLIDPRTGLPAETDLLSATVIAPTIMQAEVAAKVAMILGSAAGMCWLQAHSELAALLILENGTILTNREMEKFFA